MRVREIITLIAAVVVATVAIGAIGVTAHNWGFGDGTPQLSAVETQLMAEGYYIQSAGAVATTDHRLHITSVTWIQSGHADVTVQAGEITSFADPATGIICTVPAAGSISLTDTLHTGDVAVQRAEANPATVKGTTPGKLRVGVPFPDDTTYYAYCS
jgi:hypothetical protein